MVSAKVQDPKEDAGRLPPSLPPSLTFRCLCVCVCVLCVCVCVCVDVDNLQKIVLTSQEWCVCVCVVQARVMVPVRVCVLVHTGSHALLSVYITRT
jgi:hypothetical protein